LSVRAIWIQIGHELLKTMKNPGKPGFFVSTENLLAAGGGIWSLASH